MALRLSPPRRKKLSSRETSSMPSRSFQIAARRTSVGVRGRRPVSRGFRFGVWQPRPVDLPVRGEWHRLERHDPRGQHVLGQPRRQVRAKALLRHALAVTPHHPGRQGLPLLVLPHVHHRLPDGAVLEQHGLHLARLDPVAPDLHLPVETSQELERAVRPPPAAVSRPVHPLPGTERVL